MGIKKFETAEVVQVRLAKESGKWTVGTKDMKSSSAYPKGLCIMIAKCAGAMAAHQM